MDERGAQLGDRPWLSSYRPGHPGDLIGGHSHVLAMLADACRHPDRTLVHYFGTDVSIKEVDALSSALACAMAEMGLRPNERVALYLQNVPQFLIALLATWKAGAIVVPINPMLKERELSLILQDAEVSTLISLETLYRDVAARIVSSTPVRNVITTSELDFVSDDDVAVLSSIERCPSPDASVDLLALCRSFEGRTPVAIAADPQDVALLTYTSGTTGVPKAAMNTHANVAFQSEAQRLWFGLDGNDSILALAPLFHITGLIVECALSLCSTAPMILGYRFDAKTMLELIERYRPTFSIGAITAYIALMNDPDARHRDVSSLTRVFSGGAPIPPQTVIAIEQELGWHIYNAYGLTETTAATHIVPFGAPSRVDAASGVLSIGVPYFNTFVRVVDESGADVLPGEAGELVISGPQVGAGYWRRPEETAAVFRDDGLLTGDVGFMDEDGWFYLVDRKKDMIIASGYKVWPREVEDVLYEHPAVREAAVVGVADPYRGETVKAFVSLRPGATLLPDDAIAFCRERLAAYKYPRLVEILDELPKSATGKILRRELREH